MRGCGCVGRRRFVGTTIVACFEELGHDVVIIDVEEYMMKSITP